MIHHVSRRMTPPSFGKKRIALFAASARLPFCYAHSPGTPGFAHKEEGAEKGCLGEEHCGAGLPQKNAWPKRTLSSISGGRDRTAESRSRYGPTTHSCCIERRNRRRAYSLQRNLSLKEFHELVAEVFCVEPPKQEILCPFPPAGAREVQLAAGIAKRSPPGMQRESEKQEDCFVRPECCPLPLQYSARFQQRPPGA